MSTATLAQPSAPATCETKATPRGLTPDQVAAYHRDGFLVVDNVFSPAEVEALKAASAESAIVDEQRASGADSNTYHLLGLTQKHPLFLDLVRDPRMVAKLVPLIGPDIQLHHSKLATKPTRPGAGAYAWHQDLAYFPHTNTDLATIMVMLDDCDEDNGCMRMIPGSHQGGLLDHRINGYFSGGLSKNLPYDLGTPITPKAGGISIHHCLTLHGSAANKSGRPRRGVTFQYRADDAHQLADHVFDDTGLVIAGTRRGVVRCTAGTWMLPRHHGRVGEGFGSAWNQQGPAAKRLNENSPIVQPA
jgi:ectoine hydroxylase-related dioxygenase (phytanoyl-CoA dioxygenase family)